MAYYNYEGGKMKCYIHPSIDATQTCSECGKAICDACTMEINGKLLCRSCTEKLAGAQAPTQAPPLVPPVVESPLGPAIQKKEPLLALILSFFIPGLGHLYDGLKKKGVSLIIAFIVIWFFIFVSSAITTSSTASGSSSSPYACCTCIFFLAYLAIWVYGMYDSYISAQRINKGEKVEDKLF